MCINYAAPSLQTFPELQLFEQANTYVMYADHNNLENTAEDRFSLDNDVVHITD